MATQEKNSHPSDYGIHVERGSFAHPFISWRSVLAGLLVALLIDASLIALGLALCGASIVGGLDSSASTAGMTAGVWFLVSGIVSLFVGGYFAARVSKFSTPTIGSAQAFVIAALFFAIVLTQATLSLGWASRTAGALLSGAVGAAATGAAQASQSEIVRSIAEDAIGDLNLRSSPEAVMSGLATRLIHGDATSAKIYLVRQANVSVADADHRINLANSKIQTGLQQARDRAGRTLQDIGWSLFVAMVAGALASTTGGAVGSRVNDRKPMARELAAGQAVGGMSMARV